MILLERFDEAIDEETAVVSIAAVCYRNGSRLPIEEIARIAHERGALVVLDAYQASTRVDDTWVVDVPAATVGAMGEGRLVVTLAAASAGEPLRLTGVTVAPF